MLARNVSMASRYPLRSRKKGIYNSNMKSCSSAKRYKYSFKALHGDLMYASSAALTLS